ncbi:1-acyl-sn-glycerol-3-phosphate acyltransferase [Maricaulaceae bacterium EIL42A08]|nr:1-acyl-sn-glycerol-3-phosphate acyltransferase [Maricaulaceae bacterium EIL42A08]
MRSHLFHSGFWALATILGIACAPVLLIPGRGPTVAVIGLFAKLVRGWLKLCGVSIEYRGLEHLEGVGPAVFASKHQSYGDGLCHIARDRDLAYVIGDHMLRFPLVGTYLKRAEAVVVDDAAGRRAGGAFDEGVERLNADGRSAIIFPEGGLSPVGGKRRYRRGVWKLARSLERPIIPVATNLGCFWPEEEWVLRPGEAVIEFLPPMHPGDESKTFMSKLENRIESRTRALEVEAIHHKK